MMGSFKRITLEERQLIEQYCKERKSIYRMAILLKRSQHSLHYEIAVKNDGMENYDAVKADNKSKTARTLDFSEEGVNESNRNAHLSKWEREFIQQNLYKGMSVKRIAYALKRASTTIYHEISRNGGKDVYRADEAHKRYMEQGTIRKELTGINLKKNHSQTTQMEISSLKMQVEILFEMIKDLREKNG
jgi:IS30 family transposase